MSNLESADQGREGAGVPERAPQQGRSTEAPQPIAEVPGPSSHAAPDHPSQSRQAPAAPQAEAQVPHATVPRAEALQGSPAQPEAAQAAAPQAKGKKARPPKRERVEAPGQEGGKRRWFGMPPALVLGICLLVAITILVLVLIFTGQIAEYGGRVFWTVFLMAAFTGLLALDLTLSQDNDRGLPLVLGLIASGYMMLAGMLRIWVYWPIGLGADATSVDYPSAWEGVGLLADIPLLIIGTRIAWALAWGLIALGNSVPGSLAKGLGITAASLVGLTTIFLTLPMVMKRFALQPNEWYWRFTVATVILAALAMSILGLVWWNSWRQGQEERERNAAARQAQRRPQGAQGLPVGRPGYPQPGVPAGYYGQPGAAPHAASVPPMPHGQTPPVPMGPAQQYPPVPPAGYGQPPHYPGA